MEGYKGFLSDCVSEGVKPYEVKGRNAVFERYGIYPDSVRCIGGSYFFLGRTEKDGKFLFVTGEAAEKYPFEGNECVENGVKVRICPMNNSNCEVLRRLFPFTRPSHNERGDISIGFGDRLGIASPGHLRLVKDLPVYPVLAQQSIRELKLTDRTVEDVVSAASWAVFQEGYEKGFGADGDHLKSREEVKMALDNLCTMITLDCSEHIRNDVEEMDEAGVKSLYAALDSELRKRLEAQYLGHTFSLLDGTRLSFGPEVYYRTVLVYMDAIGFTEEVYSDFIVKNKEPVDYELSIDETLTPTDPAAHYFVARELKNAGVKLASLAPRFCGEFQKGIDYIGDVKQFEKEYVLHEAIANEFGYKLSIHSGSDKFSVFPVIGRHSSRYHLKTAGTNWLEAVRLIAVKNPALYRRMHKFALGHFDEATSYYHVTTDLSKVPDIDSMSDDELPSLMELSDTRQLIHITYGLILSAKNPDGSGTFRDEFYSTLNKYEKDYYKYLEKHLGRHLEKLGLLK